MTRPRKDQNPSRKPHRATAPDEDLENLEDLEELEEPEEPGEPDDLAGDELETLEELDDPLAPLAADTLPITLATAPEENFDLRLEIAVGDRGREEIVRDLEPPLRHKLQEAADQLRWQRIVVTFTGEAVIPSAAKDLVAQIMPECKPLEVTVQRGYPDEVVYIGSLPRLEVQAVADGDDMRLQVAAHDVDEYDLPGLLKAQLEKAGAAAAGKSVTVAVQGVGYIPPEWVSEPLVGAGARRIILETDAGTDVVFDREIAELVRLDDTGEDTRVTVGTAADVATTVQALTAVLEAKPAAIQGRNVRVEFTGGSARDEETACLIGIAAKLRPSRLALGDADILWPALLRVARKEDRITLRMVPGRRADVLPALQRELRSVAVHDKELTFDWPAGTEIDPRIEAALIAAGPRSLSYSFDGENREPIWPSPLTFRADAGVTVCCLDTEAGAPAELVRAIQRRLPAQDLAGTKVDIEVQGTGLVSRTMRQTLADVLQAGGAERARLLDHGSVEYLFPELLAFTTLDDGTRRAVVTPADRSAGEIAAAAAAAFAAEDDPARGTATLRVPVSPAATAVIDAAVAAGVGRVILEGDGELLVHPPLFTAVRRDGDALVLTASPAAGGGDGDGGDGGDGGAVARQLDHELPIILEEQGSLTAVEITLVWPADGANRSRALEQLIAAGPAVVRLDDGSGHVEQVHPEIVRTYVDVLGRREAGDPPILILGVDTDDADGAAAALEALAGDIDGRRVLVVFREDGREVTGAADNPVVQATHTFLDGRARSMLVYRQASRDTPAHFEVVMSAVPGLEVGARMKDPRG